MKAKHCFDQIPKIAAAGRRKIQKAIKHVERLRDAADNEIDQRNADSAIKEALNRIAEIEKAEHRAKGIVHMLALLCYDSSIPVFQVEDPA